MGKFKAPIRISEDAIAECRDNLLADLIITESAVVNGDKYTIQDLLYYVETEDKDNIFAMLLIDSAESKTEAVRLITEAFDNQVNESYIEAHLIDEAEEAEAERRLEEEEFYN